jgi:hypothetical protein
MVATKNEANAIYKCWRMVWIGWIHVFKKGIGKIVKYTTQ